MKERRRTTRMPEENEVTITVVSGENNFPEEKINDDHFKDISVLGAKIQTNILLPVDTLLELDFTSIGVSQQINILGKVKWGKVVIGSESYDMGVEFYPSKAMEKLEDYVLWKLRYKKSESIKNNLPPIDSGDIKIVEAKNTPPVKNKQWIGISIILLGTIILIVILLTTFGSIPELDRILVPNIITKAKQVSEATPAQAPVLTPAPVQEAIPAPAREVKPTPAPAQEAAQKTIPAPEVKATPVPEAKQKTKVIGNSDSKRYHLSGMKYYNAVKASHRVEFDSEADAIKAGYNKAPQ